jgi:hypothetical protein
VDLVHRSRHAITVGIIRIGKAANLVFRDSFEQAEAEHGGRDAQRHSGLRIERAVRELAQAHNRPA